LQYNKLPPISVTCAVPSGSCLDRAMSLAESLHLPFREHPAADHGMTLTYTGTHLELRQNPTPGKASPGPLFVDFLSGSSGYRHHHNCTIGQPLARAIGIKRGFRPSVVDGTAGLGQDGFVLACLGCTVTMIERSPVLGALLDDGLQRALRDRRVGNIIRDHIQLIIADARIALQTLSLRPYTIYLDPMYPKRTKSALNKKEMRIIRALVGDDLDSSSLLECALATAENRVVVKRPKEAPPLAGRSPSHEILMKNSRFDVYLTHIPGPNSATAGSSPSHVPPAEPVA
jgi:16S rRNA (guanine1516-N2)-methyltransferase